MESTWQARDLPVLDAIVRHFEHTAGSSVPQIHDIATATGLDEDEVVRAALALESEYISLRRHMGPARGWHVEAVSANARRVVGQWPVPDEYALRLVMALNAEADRTSDPDTKGRLRRAAEALGGVPAT